MKMHTKQKRSRDEPLTEIKNSGKDAPDLCKTPQKHGDTALAVNLPAWIEIADSRGGCHPSVHMNSFYRPVVPTLCYSFDAANVASQSTVTWECNLLCNNLAGLYRWQPQQPASYGSPLGLSHRPSSRQPVFSIGRLWAAFMQITKALRYNIYYSLV